MRSGKRTSQQQAKKVIAAAAAASVMTYRVSLLFPHEIKLD
jgi:hypothetical protein